MFQPCLEVALDHTRVSSQVNGRLLVQCVPVLAMFSGLRNWLRFIEISHGYNDAAKMAFPPKLEDVLAWSTTFRHDLYSACI